MKENLLKRIENKSLSVGVIGLGYVGLPLAVEIAKSGFKTVGFDIVKEKVEMINQGCNYISDIKDEDLKCVVDKKMLRAIDSFEFVAQMDFIIICVPTPLDIHQQPDITYIRNSVTEVGRYLKKNSVVVLESTTYPGTTREVALPLLEEMSHLECEKDFYLGFSPERIDPGNETFKTSNTPKVVGGVGDDATIVISTAYRAFLDSSIFEVSSPEVAEMGKILENTYRNINVALVNEFAMLCNKMGIDIWEVIEVAKTKPYGFQAFYPGPGLGGHCIPIDPYYLTWKAREYSFHTSMIESAMMINDRMPEYCVERTIQLLNKNGKSIRDAKILVLGVAYKADINDYRESPAIEVMLLLEKQGAIIDYYDPYIREYEKNGRKYVGLNNIDAALVSSFDMVLITTGHKVVDYEMISQNGRIVFDLRNAMKDIKNRENVELL